MHNVLVNIDHQQDFETLDIESNLCNTLVDNLAVSSTVTGSSDDMHDPANCVSSMDFCQLSSPSAAGEAIASDVVEMTSSNNLEEPARLLRPGPAPKPKRFYRTFWRGLASRAVSHLI